jgi:DNA-directed RNA polymerase specialized sigma24 family protein
MRSTEDVWAGVTSLTEADLLRLKLFAGSCMRTVGQNALGRDENDLLSEAIVATATGEQLWKDDTPLAAHLLDVIRKMSSVWSHGEGEFLLGNSAEPIGGLRDGDVAALDPEKILQAKEQLDHIRRLVSGDPDASEIVELFALGYSTEEIQNDGGMSRGDYCAAMSRLRQKLQTELSESDDIGFESSLSGILSKALSDIVSADAGW